MIYDYPGPDVPIRQGDIFIGLPWAQLSLDELDIISEEGEPIKIDWSAIVNSGQSITAILGLKPVLAIVVNNNCDVLHAPAITLCRIRPFIDYHEDLKDKQALKHFVRRITKQARVNLKWFYLPPDENIGFTDRMAVDFLATLCVSRKDLENNKHLRKGTLNEIAKEHFRERLSEFYRRYPYDEWYPLNSDEFIVYKKDNKDVFPFSWQI